MLGKNEVVKSTSECYGRLADFMLQRAILTRNYELIFSKSCD